MMRGYQDYQTGMQYGLGGFDLIQLFFILLVIVILVDLVLLGFWLWKQLKKK